ncbi:protein FAR-RED IMPAIRED RESPONSE 1-like [Papaver somniferum]|uniref:protein FAR-RED IMPAIRED RESPONSE 1-like n=1 Tax=Papaver somniferum TaxID=3469 RepID=UPI000E6FF69C|nr:protein FAR-RED IMPAIRED RESPONSE 1-like [Papaver somniferum]
MTCTSKDCRNMVDKLRRIRLGEGDAAAILKYFAKMSTQNSGFYYKVDLDEEGHLDKVFWADGRSREAYKEFGDVISFDTTYLVNKYNMPFAPFVGVNHHGQSILLGSGLVSHENSDSFEWLFSQWLDCMSGHAPPAIITDQDLAMKKAVKIVLPNSRHRWCLWHVMKKLSEKFKSYKNYDRIKYSMKKVVYDTQYPSEFETKWKEMIDKYNLSNNEWLKDLYEDKERWVPCYLKGTFWAGMSSTQRSESMNSFFDGYLRPQTTLKQLVEQYELALRDKVEKEAIADAESASKMITTATEFDMDKQIQEIYTLSKYKEFQTELVKKIYCEIIRQVEEDPVGTFKYVVRESVWFKRFDKQKIKKLVNFDVIFHSKDCEVACSCQNFSFRGILCRHAISILTRQGIELLPEKYIVRRWRRDVKRSHTSMKVNVNFWENPVERERYNSLTILFSEVADMAVKNGDEFDSIKHWLVKKLEMLKKQKESAEIEPKSLSTSECKEGEETDVIEKNGEENNLHEEAMDLVGVGVLDPTSKRQKGRPRSTAYKNTWKPSNKNYSTNDASVSNEGDGDVALEVPTMTKKKRGRPPGSKNKNQNMNTNLAGDGIVQQSQATYATQESVVSNGVPPQAPVYQPWGLYPIPHSNYAGLTMDPNAVTQGSSFSYLSAVLNPWMFGGQFG